MQNEMADREYLYCFLREANPQTFTSKGMGDRGDPVTTIHYRDLGAVISPSQQGEYEGNRRNMMTHTRVLEEVMDQYSILPVRFNTIAPNQATIEQLLCQRYNELNERLDKMTGKIEMGLKALWYEGIIFDEILAEYADIRRLRDALQGRSPEETYYERIRLGEMIEEALHQQREAEATMILETLRPHVCQIQTSSLISDHMIVNAAFLVDREQESALEAAIQALDDKLGQRILFRYVGPVPPYNFVNLMLTWNGAS